MIEITQVVETAIGTLLKGTERTQVAALIAIRDEAQAQLVQLKQSMLPALRQQIAALEGIEAKVGRKRGSKNKPKVEGVAQ